MHETAHGRESVFAACGTDRPARSIVSTNETLFIGTSHLDPKGYEHLLGVLNEYRPELVLLEVSRLSIVLRKTLGIIYTKMLMRRTKRLGLAMNRELATIVDYLSPAHEYRAARDYCRDRGARLRLVDVSLFSLIAFSRAHRLITVRNLLYASRVGKDRFEQERGIAMRIFSNNDETLREVKLRRFNGDRLLRIRENLITRRVKTQLARHGDAKTAYVGGWEHLMDDHLGRVLYPRIEAPKQRRVLCIE